MPGNPRAIVAEAERRFPVRLAVKVPPGGLGHRYPAMSEWLDENCGVNGWAITSAGTRGVLNDAVAVYVSNPTCAAAGAAGASASAQKPALVSNVVPGSDPID